MLTVEDDTDLEEAAKFDFIEFLKSRGIATTKEFDDNVAPALIVKDKMEQDFAMPSQFEFKNAGELEFSFSSDI